MLDLNSHWIHKFNQWTCKVFKFTTVFPQLIAEGWFFFLCIKRGWLFERAHDFNYCSLEVDFVLLLHYLFLVKRVYNPVAHAPVLLLASCKLGCPIFLFFCLWIYNYIAWSLPWRHLACGVPEHFVFPSEHRRVPCCFLQWISKAKILLRANGSDLDHKP